MGIQEKIELFENSLERKYFTYFSNLMLFLNSWRNKLQDNFRVRFEDIERTNVPE